MIRRPSVDLENPQPIPRAGPERIAGGMLRVRHLDVLLIDHQVHPHTRCLCRFHVAHLTDVFGRPCARGPSAFDHLRRMQGGPDLDDGIQKAA